MCKLIYQHLWLDCNVYYTFLASNGIEIGSVTLGDMVYESVDFEPEKDYHDFLGRMFNEGCTKEEFEVFKKEKLRKSGFNWHNQYRENWI